MIHIRMCVASYRTNSAEYTLPRTIVHRYQRNKLVNIVKPKLIEFVSVGEQFEWGACFFHSIDFICWADAISLTDDSQCSVFGESLPSQTENVVIFIRRRLCIGLRQRTSMIFRFLSKQNVAATAIPLKSMQMLCE